MSSLFAPLSKIIVVAASAVAVPLTGSTNETTLATVTIPPLGPRDRLRVTDVWSFNAANANVKTGRIKLGGQTLGSSVGTNFLNLAHFTDICNRNAQNAQIARANPTGYGGWGGSTGAVFTGTVDTSIAQDLIITGQLASGADTMTLESYLIELIRG